MTTESDNILLSAGGGRVCFEVNNFTLTDKRKSTLSSCFKLLFITKTWLTILFNHKIDLCCACIMGGVSNGQYISDVEYIFLCQKWVYCIGDNLFVSRVRQYTVAHDTCCRLAYGARVAQWVRSLDLTTHTSLSPIRRGFAPSFVSLKKGCPRLAATSDKVYQLLAQGRWFSPGTPASSTTKTGRHDIAEILLKVALNTKNSNSNYVSLQKNST